MGRRCSDIYALALVLLATGSSARAADAPLADAAERRDASGVRAQLDRHADVKLAQADGMTALHWAAHHDDLETAKLLVKAGADARAANRYGVTPLSLACTNGHEALVELLLEAGADPNARLRGNETVLMTAARTGRLGPVKALLSRGADVNAREWRGQTALMWAAAEGHAAVVEALLRAGADFRTPLPSGFTPLFFAVREGRTDAVRALLKAGADVNEAMQPKSRPSGKAPRRGTSPLIMAVENGHFELAVALLEAGADPNDQRSGYTALHVLSWVRKPNRGDGDDGDPAPIGSGSLSSLQFVEKLLEHGADVNARLRRGQTGRGVLGRVGASPFLLACMTADVPLMRALVRHGADPRLPNAQHCTPLMAAAGVGSLAPGEEAGTEPEALEAVALAIELGNDVNAVDDNGETAMHGAAYKNFPRVVELLAARGARIEVWNRKNRYGWTPLSIAEGHRVGNFKPSPETVAALHRVMLAAGVSPPGSMPIEGRAGYSDPDRTSGGDGLTRASVAGLERSPGGPRVPLVDGFEGEAVADFWMPGNYGSGLYVPGAVAISKDRARTGSRSVRITVKEGDIAQPGGDGKSTERAELDSGYFPFLGRDVWYGFSFLVPEGFPIADVRLILSSCKQRNFGTALIAQRYRNGRHELTVWEPGPDGGENAHYALPKIAFGRWYDIVYHVRYSAGPGGLVELWVDGERVVSHGGANVDKDGESRFYNKIGLYRDRWKEPMTIYFDNYTLGDSYEAVDPARFDKKP